MTFALIGLALVAAIALSGWLIAELELRETALALDAVEEDLCVALGFDELGARREAVVLHAIDGGRS